MRMIEPIAETIYGKVRGSVEDGISVFKGIRYGADPSKERFAPAKRPRPWADVVEAKTYGNAAAGSGLSPTGLLASFVSGAPTSEDCLFLNVWTPAASSAGKRPVMVWLHG